MASFARACVGKHGDAQAENQHGDGGIKAGLPFGEMFAAVGAQFCSREVAQTFVAAAFAARQMQLGGAEFGVTGFLHVMVILPSNTRSLLEMQEMLRAAGFDASAVGKDDGIIACTMLGDEEVLIGAGIEIAGVDADAVVKAAEAVGTEQSKAGLLSGLVADGGALAVHIGHNHQREIQEQGADGSGAYKDDAVDVGAADAAGEYGAHFLVAVEAA